MEPIKIFAAGVCKGDNTIWRGAGAYGVVLQYKDYIKEIKGKFLSSTKHRMEIMAVIKGLRMLKKDAYPVEIYSDSQIIIGTFNEDYRRKANLDYWWELDKELQKFSASSIKWIKVKKETNSSYNRALEIANEILV